MEGDENEEKTGLDARALDSRAAPRRESEEVWESLLTPVTSPDRLWKQPFGGSIHAWHGGEAMLCDVKADQQITRRDARQLSLGPPPVYTLLLVCRGRLRYQDARRSFCLLPGDILVEDMAAPRTLVTQTHRTLQLILPYAVSGMVLPSDLHGELLPRKHTATRLLARHLLGLRAVVDQLSPRAFSTQLEVASHLLLASLPATKRQWSEMSHLQLVIRQEIERYINNHLDLPELNATHLGAVFKMSRSQLYRLFRSSGGPSAYIHLKRLHVASRRIQAQRNHPEQWEYISETLGFGSVSGLDRALRERFDSSVEQLAASADDQLDLHRADTVKALFQRLPAARHDSNSTEI